MLGVADPIEDGEARLKTIVGAAIVRVNISAPVIPAMKVVLHGGIRRQRFVRIVLPQRVTAHIAHVGHGMGGPLVGDGNPDLGMKPGIVLIHEDRVDARIGSVVGRVLSIHAYPAWKCPCACRMAHDHPQRPATSCNSCRVLPGTVGD